MVDYNEIMGALGEDLPQPKSIIQGLPDSGPTKNPYTKLMEVLRTGVHDNGLIQQPLLNMGGEWVNGYGTPGGNPLYGGTIVNLGPAAADLRHIENMVAALQEELIDVPAGADAARRGLLQPLLPPLGGRAGRKTAKTIADRLPGGSGHFLEAETPTRVSPLRLFGWLQGREQAGRLFPGTLADHFSTELMPYGNISSSSWPMLDKGNRWSGWAPFAVGDYVPSPLDEFYGGYRDGSEQVVQQAGRRFGIMAETAPYADELVQQLQEAGTPHGLQSVVPGTGGVYGSAVEAIDLNRNASVRNVLNAQLYDRTRGPRPEVLARVLRENADPRLLGERGLTGSRVARAFGDTFPAADIPRILRNGGELSQEAMRLAPRSSQPAVSKLVTGALEKAKKGGVSRGLLGIPLALGGAFLGSKLFPEKDDSFAAQTARAIGMA